MKKHLSLWMLVGMFSSHLHAQDLYIEPGAAMHVGTGAILTVQGNITVQNSSGITGTGTLLLNGTAAQTISGDATSLPALSLNNSAGVRIIKNKSLAGNLTLNATILTVDSGQAIHVNQNAVSRSSGFVNGRLAKTFTPSALTKTFEVGNDGDYLPVSLSYASSSSNFEVAVESKSNAINPLPTAISNSKYVDAHYSLFNVASAPSNYNAQFTFLPSQLQNSADTSALLAIIDTASNNFTGTFNQTTSTNNTASFNLNRYGRIQLGESGSIVVNLKTILEGFYAGNGKMLPVLENSGVVVNNTLTDTLTLELRSAISPYNFIDMRKAVIDTGGNGVFVFNNIAPGNYYLVARHRNHLATWSANAVYCTPSTFYNFSDAASKAFGDNIKDMNDGVFALYAGDANQDEFIDGSDYNPTLNLIFEAGYYEGDINGDGFLDGSDYNLILNNIYVGALYNSFSTQKNITKTKRPY